MDLDGVLAEATFRRWEMAHRHQLVAEEVLPRPSND